MADSQNKKINRRRFLSRSAALGAGAATMANVSSSNAEVDVSFVTDFEKPVKPFIDQYYDGHMEIAKGTRDESVGTITKAMEKATSAYRTAGKYIVVYRPVILLCLREVKT